MLFIVIASVIAIIALQASGAVPDASVGGAMTIAFACLSGAVAVGIHDAWTNRRGAGGSILSLVVAFFGGLAAAFAAGMAMDVVMPLLPLEGSLAETGGPMLYISLAAMMLVTLFGAWLALRLVNRMR
jgi:hypothetical protein